MLFTGERPIIITAHRDTPGVLSHITALLYERDINIGDMRVTRSREDKSAHMYVELDSLCGQDLTAAIRQIPGIIRVKLLLPIDETEFPERSRQ